MMKNKGRLFLISGPSGVGKGTICKELINNNENIYVSVSATTRKPRDGEVDGVNYYFKTVEEFKEMIDKKEFLEWAQYNGNYYGTPKSAVFERLDNGFDVILEIEVQGALTVKENYDGGVYIFIAPPDENALFNRLKNRGTETEIEIEKRLNAAKIELEKKNEYDYIVVNDILDTAVSEIENIMKKERNKI